MHPPLDHPAWGSLSNRERVRLADRIAADCARINDAIAHEARIGGPPAIRFVGGIPAVTAAVAQARRAALGRWTRTARLTGLAGLVAAALAFAGAEALGGIEIAAGLAALLLAALGVGLTLARRQALRTVAEDDAAVIIAAGRDTATVDRNGVHLYSVVPGARDATGKHWPAETLRAVSYGWPGLPGLMLSTSQRKRHLPYTVALAGTEEVPIDVARADAILAEILGERYAGTTLAQCAA